MTIVEERSVAREQAAARKAMIDSQLRTSGVTAGFVLERMAAVPREDFVPETARKYAYVDRAIPLGNGRYLAAPLVQGRMLEEAAPTLADKALLVDGGSGYLAELLRPLVGTLEVVLPDAAQAKARKHGEFTLLIVDGAIEQLPAALAARLAENARVVTGLISRGVTRLAAGRKTGGDVPLVPLAEMGIPALPEFAAPKGWSF
ncbi:MAG TPA: protein-L-isoaspartate O-methyltransferase [Sphingomonadaceae bacterium]